MADRIGRQQGSASGYIAEGVKAARRHVRPSNGVTGAGGYYTTSLYTIAKGANADIDTGWTSWFSEANGGLSLVSGFPTYAPGVYFTTVQMFVTWVSDGHEDEPHVIGVDEAAIQATNQVALGNLGGYWKFQGRTWFGDPATSCALNVSYSAGPAASSADMLIHALYFSTLRLGDMP